MKIVYYIVMACALLLVPMCSMPVWAQGARYVQSLQMTDTKFDKADTGNFEFELSAGSFTFDAIGAAADTTFTVTNSNGSYEANLALEGDLTVSGATTALNSATISTDETTLALFNTTATTINFGGAATVNMAGAATVGGGYSSTGVTLSTAGVGQFAGALTTDGVLTANSIVTAGNIGIAADLDVLELASAAITFNKGNAGIMYFEQARYIGNDETHGGIHWVTGIDHALKAKIWTASNSDSGGTGQLRMAFGAGSAGGVTEQMSLKGGYLGIGTATPSVALDVVGDIKSTGDLVVDGYNVGITGDGLMTFSAGRVTIDDWLCVGAPTELTIASDTITPVRSFHSVDTEGDASTDNVTAIAGGSTGDILILKSVDNARDPTFVDGGGLFLAGNFTLGGNADSLTLLCVGAGCWMELDRSDN